MDFKTQWHKGSRRDFLATQYLQDTRPIQARVSMLKKETDNGFTQDRTMQHIGSIPITIWLEHPEFMEDPRSIDRWLRTEEARPYRIAKGI
jgi:hypothetical protein